MTMPSQPAQAAPPDPPQPAVSVNGTAPGAAAAGAGDCDDCTSTGERALAIAGIIIGLGIIALAVDVASGYRISRAVGLGKTGDTGDGNDGGS